MNHNKFKRLHCLLPSCTKTFRTTGGLAMHTRVHAANGELIASITGGDCDASEKKYKFSLPEKQAENDSPRIKRGAEGIYGKTAR